MLPNHLVHAAQCARQQAGAPFSIMKFSQSPYVFHKKMCLSNDPDATMSPPGLNFIVNTSPA